MITFIIVPPGDRLFKQSTLHGLHGVGRTVCIIPEEEEKRWRIRPVETISYSRWDLPSIRDMIQVEFENEDTHIVARDDLVLMRRLPHIGRLKQCTKRDIEVLMEWIQNQQCKHGSISDRRRNKEVWEQWTTITAPSSFNFYKPSDRIFLDTPGTLIDEDLTLHLLRGGEKNVVNYEFACRRNTTKEITKEDAFALEKIHPGFVEAVQRINGTWGVVCQWRKAFESH